MRRRFALAFFCMVFIATFSVGLLANHRLYDCIRFYDAGINWYNGGTGDYYNIFDEEVLTDSDSWENLTSISFNSVGSYGTDDQINAFNGSYGATGWLGIADPIDRFGCQIFWAEAHLNQTYLDSYTRTEKKHVACHEVGHTIGLAHRTGSGTCLTTTAFPDYPDSHDQDVVDESYATSICDSCARVALQANNGQWVTAVTGGRNVVNANSNGVGPYETFQLVDLGGGYVALQANNGQYVVAEGGGGGDVNANRDGIGSWETFLLVDLGGGAVAFQAASGQYLVAESSGGGPVYADRWSIGAWETFQLSYQ